MKRPPKKIFVEGKILGVARFPVQFSITCKPETIGNAFKHLQTKNIKVIRVKDYLKE